LLVAASLWLLEKTQNSQGLSRSFALFISVILLAFSLWLIPNSYKENSEEIEGNEYRFSSERLENLRLNQQAVFLNFTADWCITCKVNEAIALNRESVKKILADKNIVYLKADWTRKDPEIASMLANYGRTGVPLYILFPTQGEPIILPELLTEDLLVDFINKIN
jgi:thiol:disulfide interchange protein DsbD